MSINLTDPHVRYTKITNFGPQSEISKYCDPIYDNVNINNWTIRREIDQNGKITLTANKGLIEIKVESAEKSALPLRAIEDKLQKLWEQPKYIEIPDGQNKMSDSLEKDRFIEKHYRDSSILTPSEYMDSLIPEFYEIPTIAKLNEIVTKLKVAK
jgi:hypothetical protein